jgi:solute carrier family 25 (mitochondrial S-adenosylmethionine transporter), member 26
MKTAAVSVAAGGIAGMSIDFALFPVDSIKTRLQASSNKVDFTKTASDVSKFRGLASAMAAAFPCAAMFWLSYEYGKFYMRTATDGKVNVHV